MTLAERIAERVAEISSGRDFMREIRLVLRDGQFPYRFELDLRTVEFRRGTSLDRLAQTQRLQQRLADLLTMNSAGDPGLRILLEWAAETRRLVRCQTVERRLAERQAWRVARTVRRVFGAPHTFFSQRAAKRFASREEAERQAIREAVFRVKFPYLLIPQPAAKTPAGAGPR